MCERHRSCTMRYGFFSVYPTFRVMTQSCWLNGLDVFLLGQKQPSDLLGQRLCLLPMGKFGHEEHVCGTLHDCEYGVVVPIHNQIHLKIPKAFSVRLLGTRVNARSIGYGERLAFGAAPIFEFVTRVARQFSACIGMDQIVDTLM